MISFDSILKNHKTTNCPLPLWKLKLTDEEFGELRALLEKQTHKYIKSHNSDSNPFLLYCKECTLFFAEYWRRLYEVGSHSKRMVYNALGSTRHDVDYTDEFYEAACRGANALKIERYLGDRSSLLEDMLYQGGLPMKLVTSNIANSNWDRFTRGLVNRRYNFDELNLGAVASQSASMKEYCEQLIRGIEVGNYMVMPFYCENEHNKWFLYLNELANQEKRRLSQSTPFSLKWEFDINHIDRKVFVKYIVKGSQQLPQQFLKENELYNISSFSVQVRRNGLPIDSYDYVKNFCRYAVVSKHPYCAEDIISLFIENQEEAYLEGSIDLNIPHLLFRNYEGNYEVGNRIGQQESFILMPKNWEVDKSCCLNANEYFWGQNVLRGIILPTDFSENIRLSGDDGVITFGANAPTYWTEMHSHPLYLPNVKGIFYNATKSIFTICRNTEDGKEFRKVIVLYRNKWQKEWSVNPSYGEIYARAIAPQGNYVSPVRFINIGEGVSVNLHRADKDSCLLSVSWPHGQVSTTEGERKSGNVWEVKKDNCKDPRLIRFLLTPNENSLNQFTIYIKAPFKEFSIVNPYGNEVQNDSWISYTDVDRFQYHLVGQDVKEYSYGGVKRELKWRDGKLQIIENGIALKYIPYTGSLITLFDSRDVLRALLERTSQNLIKAEINVKFTLSNGKDLSFSIKEFPFVPQQKEGGKIIITSRNKKSIQFEGVLKLIKLDEPNLEPIELRPEAESKEYFLPETIREWGKTILIGRTRGRIRPILVDLNREMDSDFRARNRDNAISTIQESLNTSVLGDELWQRIIGWFDRVNKDDIPASSILELYCTAQNHKALICLVFQLYNRSTTEDELNLLKEMLMSLSKDLAFQWYWLQPYLGESKSILSDFVREPKNACFVQMYIRWALSKDEKCGELLSYISTNEDEYFNNLVQALDWSIISFTKWLKDLYVESLIDSYETDNHGDVLLAENIIDGKVIRVEAQNEVFVDANQTNLDDREVVQFFESYADIGHYGNEKWLSERVNVVAAHLRKKVNLFSENEAIRRSILFCSKSSNVHFVKTLNNKLSHLD